MEELEAIWQRLNLTYDEGVLIKVADEKLGEEIRKVDNCLVRKIHLDRAISREVLQTIMQKV